ncbi:uncharacterized protein LOC131236247 isoform X2 [Magnolia sinica]|uniref:uncharacterized protein LOC131236247 isoform X2 n=1 Tax=Magnolia sinica TaxID=86752 RepID=UPI00265B4BE4|nr:uncharacterized protein LOC131236247 isoform X2 [Magnolia sinica]
MVTGDQFPEESICDTSDARFTSEPFSIWPVGNEVGTFIVCSGFRKPPKRFSLKLADPNASSHSDNTVIDAEIRTFSAALFDDYGGLMSCYWHGNLQTSGVRNASNINGGSVLFGFNRFSRPVGIPGWPFCQNFCQC